MRTMATPPRSRLGSSRRRRFAAAAFLLAATAFGQAQTQSVTPGVGMAFQTKNPSEAVSITFVYDNDTTPSTTGIGVRVHFDSSRLTFDSAVPFDASGGSLFVMGPSEVMDDVANHDGDPNNDTDKFILLAWAHTESGFPGAVPHNLFTVSFTTAADFSISTNVNVTAVDTAIGFGFASSPATVAPPGAPTPTPTATPMGPTPTPTSTPTPSGDTAILDIDGNGLVHGLSDGIAILRWMFGFTGSDLITDVVAPPPSCTRCTAAEVEAYLQSLSE